MVLAMIWRAGRLATTGYVVVIVVGGVTPPAAAWLTKLVIDRLTHGSFATGPAVGLAGLSVATAMTPQFTRYLDAQVRRGTGMIIQDRLFTAVNGFAGLGRFEDPRHLDRIRMAQQNGQAAPVQLVSALFMAAQGALSLIGYLTALTVISVPMAGVVLVSSLPLLLIELRLSRRRADFLWNTTSLSRRQNLYAGLMTDARTAKEIRLFGLGNWFRDRLLDQTRKINSAERSLDRRVLFGQGGLALLGALVAGGGLVWAVLQIRKGDLTVGDIAVLSAALTGTQSALAGLVGRTADGYQALLTLRHYEEITTAGPDLPRATPSRPAPALRHAIELEGVWFRYADGHPWVLQDVSLTIPFGQAIALVGRNGSGKSTLVKLLCRLYDPVRGRILWDGIDLRRLPVDELRARIGAVFQDYVCYDLTARENIGIGDLAALHDLDLIRAAAGRADIDRELAALPHGYATPLSRGYFAEADGVDGTTLSGGQLQRVALARALMRDRRDLLILDEPSSGLDAEAEHRIHQRLRAHRAGRTSLLISHRLGAVRDADEIVVLSGGRVAEQGQHDDLIAADGEYARLFHLQAESYGAPQTNGRGVLQTDEPGTDASPRGRESLRTTTPSTPSRGR